MRLAKAKICNFRSIKEVTIDFEPRCRVLVGINESGKSNILRALALLDKSRKPEPADLRDVLPEEDAPESADVSFVFALDKAERAACLTQAKPKILGASDSQPIIANGSQKLSLAQFFDTRSEGIYEVDLASGQRRATGWVLPDSFTIVGKWFKPSPTCPSGVELTLPDGTATTLDSYSLLAANLIPDVSATYLIPATAEDVNDVAIDEISKVVNDTLPACLFWSYSESNLLPPQIPLDPFASTPTICEPLRQMFALADIESIGQEIAQAKRRPNGIRNLLNRVATQATKHMKSVWKDYKGIAIELSPNGPNVDASIKDEFNRYDFSRRSDGFKRFITFLIMVSAKARTDELENTLYLHDEPDISLHPSGARCLRDELIKIAEKNYVVYSTHSIFMIDRELQHRHLIVEKSGEITDVREVDESNITDEEVIYNALGYSIFESLKKSNIVFEGWRDKRLCKVALRAVPAKHKNLKAVFREVGMCHARGVKDIGRVTPMLELANRLWIVVSDGDPPAVERQKAYEGDGRWLRYDELLPDSGVLTAEDFVKAEAYKVHIDALRSENPCLTDLPSGALESGEPKLTIIKKWLQGGGFAQDQQKIALEALKEKLFDGLKPSQIEERYYEVLYSIATQLAKADDALELKASV